MKGHSKEHLLEKIQSLYGGHLHNTAKKLLINGTLLEDMKSELLLAVHQWVVRYNYDVTDPKVMLTGIFCRGLELRKKSLNYSKRFVAFGAIPESLENTSAPPGVDHSKARRELELKTLLRQEIGGLDARIVIALVFPSPKVKTYARRHPVCGKRAIRKVNHRREAVVRKQHVAKVLGIPRSRVTLALKNTGQMFLSGTYNWIGELNEEI